jgi:acyl-CoA synthetase (AMP-forming)/AMP-acid ligase II
MNCVHRLLEHAEARPDVPAVIEDGSGTSVSFAGLATRTAAIAAGLTDLGVKPGDRALVMVRPGIDLISIIYGLFRQGALPVLIDPGMGREALLRCVAHTKPVALIGIPLAHTASLLFPGAFRSVKHRVTVGTAWLWGGATLAGWLTAGRAAPPLLRHDRDDAAILFTSGSTGPAKGVRYTHGVFNAQIDLLRRGWGFEPGEVDCAAFPAFSLFDPGLGMTSVIPELDATKMARCDPARVARAIQRNGATTAFGSPVVWRRVVPWARQTGTTFPGLRRILIAGASVEPALIRGLLELIPDGDVGTPYGATEALPVSAMGGREVMADTASRSADGAGTCVGRPVKGVDVAVIRIDDGPISAWDEALRVPAGAVGELCVRGPAVTPGYVDRPDADAAARIPDGEGSWHRMGDLGRFDELGRLWFCGRKAERVGELYTDCVEGVYNPEAGRTALVGVNGRPVLVVEGGEDPALRQRILARGQVTQVLFHPAFPVDPRHNSKIQRVRLAAWAAARMPA